MAKSLANFIVGIGADTSGFKDGMKEVNSGMLSVRTGALAAGAALATKIVKLVFVGENATLDNLGVANQLIWAVE